MDVPFRVAELLDQTFIRQAEVHARLPSTQDRARELRGDPALQTPALVVATRQTAGRGRAGHSWWSPAGALMLSILVPLDRRRLDRSASSLIALTAAVAVAELLDQEFARCGVKPAVRIKWPNDVYVDDAKVAGLLIDLPHPRPQPLAIIGVGLNVNNAIENAPGSVAAGAVSLHDITGEQHDLQSILISLLQIMETKLRQLTHDRAAVQADWQSRCYLAGKVVSVRQAEQIIRGRCLGMAEDGALLVAVEGQQQPASIYTGTVLPPATR